MLKRSINLALVGVMVFCMAMVTVNTAKASDPGPETITFAVENPTKPVIVFNHKLHQGLSECGECHHGEDADGALVAYVDGQAIPKCIKCHRHEVEEGKSATQSVYAKKLHKNCKDCHKAANKKSGTKSAPTSCTKCHVKAK